MTHMDSDLSRNLATKWLPLVLFLLVVIGLGSLIGIVTAPGEWYQGLEKPFFNPPNWIFAPVWFTLYVLIAIAGWRVFMRAPKSGAMDFWYVQMAANWVWSPVFFSAHLLWPALGVLMVMWVSIAGFMFTAHRIDRPAAWMMAPYLAWVSFAGLLNLAIAWLN